MNQTELRQNDLGALGDDELVRLARGGTEAAIRTLIARHNQRLFRVARAVLRSDDEAEDVVQASYMRAFPASLRFVAMRSFRHG